MLQPSKSMQTTHEPTQTAFPQTLLVFTTNGAGESEKRNGV